MDVLVIAGEAMIGTGFSIIGVALVLAKHYTRRPDPDAELFFAARAQEEDVTNELSDSTTDAALWTP